MTSTSRSRSSRRRCRSCRRTASCRSRAASTTARAKLAHELVNPVAADTTSLRRGKNAFFTYCTPCHGLSGEGNGTVAKSLPIPPVNLTDALLQSQRSDGSIYYTIRHGNVIMPGYAYALTPERAWDLVHYVRTLKRP